MRKIFLLTFLALGFFACTINEGPDVNVFSETYTVEKSHWNKASDEELGNYLWYEFDEPALTREVFNYGILNAYLKIGDKLYPLPFDDFYINNSGQWTEQVSCEFRPGFITFIVKYDDQELVFPSSNYTFLVRLMW
ncbi:MAG: hypothetical protein LBU22_11150 [Dysgonamonadaceae bacterium]|jgi:hypothetical protein|nr:hypothetical protein [Dysgonamonadaceae bacterium]